MAKHDSNLGHLYQDTAGRFKALSRLFAQLGSQDASQRLLESLISEDAKAFALLIEPVEIPGFPQLGKCFWVREIIERVLVTPTGFVKECWLRENLTPEERALYLQIAFRYRQGRAIAVGMMEVTLRAGRSVIPAGPFRDELEANGLVACEQRMTYDTSTTLVPTRPERVCV